MAHFAVHGVASGTPQTFSFDEVDEVITVLNRGTAEIYFTIASDGVAPNVPAVTGTDCYVVAAVVGAQVSVPTGPAPVKVAVVSSGTPAFSIEGGLTTPISDT